MLACAEASQCATQQISIIKRYSRPIRRDAQIGFEFSGRGRRPSTVLTLALSCANPASNSLGQPYERRLRRI